jgi:hypothetical protein
LDIIENKTINRLVKNLELIDPKYYPEYDTLIDLNLSNIKQDQTFDLNNEEIILVKKNIVIQKELEYMSKLKNSKKNSSNKSDNVNTNTNTNTNKNKDNKDKYNSSNSSLNLFGIDFSYMKIRTDMKTFLIINVLAILLYMISKLFKRNENTNTNNNNNNKNDQYTKGKINDKKNNKKK